MTTPNPTPASTTPTDPTGGPMTQRVDLNALRDRLITNQTTGNARPADTAEKVYVDPDGRIVLGGTDAATPGGPGGAERTLSEVPQTTFAR